MSEATALDDELVSRRWWLFGGVFIALVALACLVFQLRLPGLLPTDADYAAVAKVLEAERQPGDVVLLYPWWTEKARLFVPEGLRVVGYQGSDDDELITSPRIWVLAQPNLPRASMSDFMKRFEPSRREQGTERTFGNLSLRLFTNGRARPVLFDALQMLSSAQTYVEAANGARQAVQLQSGWNEILYQPRRCIRLDAPGPGQRKVAEFNGVPASQLRLYAGYVWDRGSFVDGVSDAEIVVEVNGQRRPLPMPRGGEGLKTLELGPVADGTTVKVSSTAANPHERWLCFELYGFGSATP